MEAIHHRLSELFAQLGLPTDTAGMREFIASHAPLPGTLRLADAPFWSPSQARMLRETIADDADWAEIVDQFDALLRRAPAAA
ncbi:conserved hypothetical protein [Rubrivivax sp. A210]|uniref:DUF2789 domain-containing protein n=1 Tax=Rubrivivax sp. A210 TaxID=2772301 RepID=UPI001919735C|nr:DUF2789 domain-containing protein [Rubrivivax sp. A210]CAD5374536.1 conserved hypothetical protein [Rubrivivax sp. A210]